MLLPLTRCFAVGQQLPDRRRRPSCTAPLTKTWGGRTPIASWETGAMKFNHVGIPTTSGFEGEIDLPHLKVTVSDHQSNPFGIQWMRYWDGAPYPDLVKTVAHVAFEVDDLEHALCGQEVIIPPNSPSAGVIVAFIKVAGAPIELLQIDRAIRSDL